MNRNIPPTNPRPPYPVRPAYPQNRVEQFQRVRVAPPPARRKSRMGCCSCALFAVIPAVALLVLVAAYFLAPLRTTFLVLGIDRVPDGTALGRSDTMILTTVDPLLPTVSMLSIPRDLWVTIPGVGENRINTAHFFAEAAVPGSGPEAAAQTVRENFGVPVYYYARVRFDAFLRIVDALGGVDITLTEDTALLTAGTHHLDGPQALAFVRDRKNGDDFFRMEHSQILLRGIAKQMLLPSSWPRVPAVAAAALSSVDTNIPVWLWPRLGLAILRAGAGDGLDSRSIQREMVQPYTTDEGAQVLLPQWEQINPLVDQLFPQ